MRWMILFALLGQNCAAWADAAALKAEAGGFAGEPVKVDTRIAVPACPAPFELKWRDGTRRAVIARCGSTGWQIALPVSGGHAGAPLVRRGQPVQVAAVGSGFRVVIHAIAEGDGRAGGQLLVRNARSGQRFLASMDADGRLVLAGGGM